MEIGVFHLEVGIQIRVEEDSNPGSLDAWPPPYQLSHFRFLLNNVIMELNLLTVILTPTIRTDLV